MAKEQTTFTYPSDTFSAYQPSPLVGAEGFYNDLLDATFIASEDRHRYTKRRVLTEFRQLKRF